MDQFEEIRRHGGSVSKLTRMIGAVALFFASAVTVISVNSVPASAAGAPSLISRSHPQPQCKSTTASVSRSPYQASLVSLVVASTGSPDAQLLNITPNCPVEMTTQVMVNGSPLSGTVALGSSVWDTATLASPSNSTGGTVTYSRYANLTCSGTPAKETVTVSRGVVPPSTAFTPGAGAYSYSASYSGDDHDTASASGCEPFSVGQAAVSLKTTVYDASTNNPLGSSVPLGVSVYDTSTLTTSTGFVPTGTVTYKFYKGGTCTTGSLVATEHKTVSGGSVPNSSVQGPLDASQGPYAYQATYSGDGNFVAGSSDCEPFTVGKGSLSLNTIVFDATSHQEVSSPVPLGSTVYDTSTITTSNGVVPTGTVTYRFYKGGSCTTGSLVGTETLSILSGSIPNSSNHGPLDAVHGPYAFQASYSGDSNFVAGSSTCEPFTVGKGSASLTTTVFNASTNQAASSPVPLGSTVYDTSTITTSNGLVPTGTVTYKFYKGGSCTTGSLVSSEPVTISSGSVPNSPSHGPLDVSHGPYAFQASYSGDSNFDESHSACEPFAVAPATPSVTTVVYNNLNDQQLQSPVPFGSTVYDTSTVTTSTGFVPTGSLTYTFYAGGACEPAYSAGTSTVTLSGGVVPKSSTQGPLDVVHGPYAYQASYSGDANFTARTSDCEPFTLTKGSVEVPTVVFDASSNKPISSTVFAGESVYDTSKLDHSTNFSPGGTVTYTYYQGGGCSPIYSVSSETVTVSSGLVPDSSTQGPLDVPHGPYAFQASYSGDGNYLAATSGCESFAVGKAILSSLNTTVYDASNDSPVSEVVALGTTVYDTTTLTTASHLTPTGTVTYTFYNTGSCTTGTVVGTPQVENLSGGKAPRSSQQGPLDIAHSPYAYTVTYSGDANFEGQTSACEPFTVSRIGPAPPAPTTTVYDAATNLAISSPVKYATSVYDTTSMSVTPGVPPTGTVTYTFYRSGSCSTGTVVGVPQTVTLSGGLTPQSAATGPLNAAKGPYAFQAFYAGDLNYPPATSACEPFLVSPLVPTISTTLSSSTVLVRGSMHDSATLHGATVDAVGSVTYTAYLDSSCSTVVASGGVVSVTNGVVPDSASMAFLAAGTVYLQAAYSGDANNSAAKSGCTAELLSVTTPPSGGVQTGQAARVARSALPWIVGLLVAGIAAIILSRRLRRDSTS